MDDKIIIYLVSRIPKDFTNFLYCEDSDCFFHRNTKTNVWQIDHSEQILAETISTQLPSLLFNEFQETISTDQNLYIKSILSLRNKLDMIFNWLEKLDNVHILIKKMKIKKQSNKVWK